jgi:hypothetical protein
VRERRLMATIMKVRFEAGGRSTLTWREVFWIHALANLESKQMEGVEFTVKGCAPYEDKIPIFNADRVLQYPSQLTLREYNGLMRILVPCLLNGSQGQPTEELSQITRDVEVRSDLATWIGFIFASRTRVPPVYLSCPKFETPRTFARLQGRK